MQQQFEEYSATGFGRLARNIDELRVPERPRFVSDLLCVSAEGSAFYIFGGEPQVLHGATVEWLVTTLLPKLDGTRTVDELAQCLPELSEEALSDVLHLLRLHGMLEGAPEPVGDSAPESLEREYAKQMTFFSRYLRVTGSCRNRYEAQQRLQASRVAVVGENEACQTLSAQLAMHGVGSLSHEAFEEIGRSSQPDLVVCIGDYDAHVLAAKRCLSEDISLLCVNCEHLVLGPLMVPRLTACPTCVSLQETLHSIDHGRPSPVQDLWAHAMLSAATQRVIAYLTLMYQVEAPGEVEIWEPQHGRATRHRDVVRLPNCPICGAAVHPLTLTLPGGHRDNMAVLFHQASAIMPWHLAQPALMRQHVNPRVVHTVRTAFTEHPEATRIALCEFEALTRAVVGNALSDRVAESAECDLKRLASVLHFSAGGVVVPADDGERHIKRYTASGGNLGSAEVYAVVRSVAGVSAGIYHYLLIGDTLERLGELTEADWTAWLRSGQLPVDPDAVIVVVSDVEREFSKYSNRGYLYCLLDAGLMAHRLSFLAGQVGLEAEVLSDFDDREVQRLLNLPVPASVPACIVALRGSR